MTKYIKEFYVCPLVELKLSKSRKLQIITFVVWRLQASIYIKTPSLSSSWPRLSLSLYIDLSLKVLEWRLISLHQKIRTRYPRMNKEQALRGPMNALFAREVSPVHKPWEVTWIFIVETKPSSNKLYQVKLLNNLWTSQRLSPRILRIIRAQYSL